MVDILTKEAASNTLTNFVKTLITDSLGENIINACKFIYPLTNVLVRKVKMLKRQKLDAAKLNDLFKEGREEVVKGPEAGKAAENEEESKNLLKK
jgi:small subunit ribosomal protein S3Ae